MKSPWSTGVRGLLVRDKNRRKYSHSFGQNTGIQKKPDGTVDKMQEYRRNWTGLWTNYRNTEETGQDLGQNRGIQKRLDRTLDKMHEYRRNWTGKWAK
jgi:hypothetical protein